MTHMNSLDECALYTTDISYNRNAEELEKYSAIKHPSVKIQAPTFKVDFAKTDAKNSGSKIQNTSLGNGNLNPVSQKVEDKIEKNVLSVESNEKVAGGSAASTSSNTKGKVTTDVPVKSVGKNNIMSMFSKQAEKNVLSMKKIDSPPSAKEETIIPKIETEEKSLPTISKKSNSQNTKSSQKRKSSERQLNKKSKHKRDSDSEEEMQPKKKKQHRRICTFEDSDSDSENEEMQDKAQRNVLNSPDEIFTAAVASDDSEESIPPTPPVHNAVKIKGKVWKTVQKTYQDDDGFFVTKKEKELVTASEDSDEDPLKISNVKEVPAKKSPSKTVHTAKKQASLTNYFNRK
ncbi:DNA polymerase delta subunit 3-like [Uloborus diversus]|uniref:DNA polymerase delta subunit 3-like n=1 Tax=Uloborus diversus TaxID=327109 RepID=UPI002409C29E|nr:DNA polymerase delta subunit 3-like [Uloborus diversus]